MQRNLATLKVVPSAFMAGPVYRWKFERRGKPVTVSTSGPVVVNDAQFMIRALLDGVGLAYVLEDYVAEHRYRAEPKATLARCGSHAPPPRRLLRSAGDTTAGNGGQGPWLADS